jgi:hypothetical protein
MRIVIRSLCQRAKQPFTLARGRVYATCRGGRAIGSEVWRRAPRRCSFHESGCGGCRFVPTPFHTLWRLISRASLALSPPAGDALLDRVRRMAHLSCMSLVLGASIFLHIKCVKKWLSGVELHTWATLPAKWLFLSLHVMRRCAASASSTAHEQL